MTAPDRMPEAFENSLHDAGHPHMEPPANPGRFRRRCAFAPKEPEIRQLWEVPYMSYAAIMVYVEADATPEHRVRLAATLAGKFNSMLIGLSALALPPPIAADGILLDGPTSMDLDLIKAKLADRGKWFSSIAHGDPQRTEWRSSLDLPIGAVTRAARSADLVVYWAGDGNGRRLQGARCWRSGSEEGRPVLVVPDAVSTLRAEHVGIGWKDTREARRAVYDALPSSKLRRA